MEFEIQEIRDLAEFFAKRFPAVADRQRIAQSAGLPSENLGGDGLQAWERVVRLAMEGGKLWNLAEAARIARPADANLRDLANAVKTSGGGKGRGYLAAAVVVLAVGGFGFALTQPNPLSDAEPADSPIAVVEPAVESDELASEVETTLAVTEPGEEGASTVVEDAPKVAAASVPPVEPAPTNTPAVERKPSVTTNAAVAVANPLKRKRRIIPADGVHGRCGGAKEEIVGYWYAGEARPGQAGQVIDIGRTVNVRMDYPRYNNGYSSRSEVVCWLKTGDKVKLTQAPIYVDGDVYWVPLVAGDLIAVPTSDA